MLRLLALLFLLLGLLVLGHDLYTSMLSDGVIRLSALGELWALVHRDSLLLLQPAVERHISPEIWDPGVQTLLEWPAAVEFLVLAAVFWLLRSLRLFLRRRRNRRFHR